MNTSRWIIQISSGACKGMFVKSSLDGKVSLCDKPKKAERFPTHAIAEQRVQEIKTRYPIFNTLNVVDTYEAF